MIDCSVGWQVKRIRWSEPNFDFSPDGDEIPRTDYRVDTEEYPRFKEFLAFFDKAFRTIGDCLTFKLAAQRYLRALRFASPASADLYDDADYELLLYVSALESLLSEKGEIGTADKLSTRAAWLVGTSNRLRGETCDAVKDIYDRRSRIVHGSTKTKTTLYDRYDVRNLIRRIIVGWMAVCLKTGSKEKCLELLKAATINQDGQAQIAEATEGAWSLLDGAMRRAWGPKYDQRTEPASE